jgi:hypothetical protein
MQMPSFTQEERNAMRESFLEVNPEQLRKAKLVASLLADEEENPEDARLALMFYFSLDENKDELESIMGELMLDGE